MSKYLIDSTTMEGIASSIKELTGNNGPINGSNLVTTLSSIEINQPDPFETEYDDNILRFFFDFKDFNCLHLYINSRLNGTIDVNWGDNTSTETYTNYNTLTQNTIIDHQYSNIGKYIISITKKTLDTIFTSPYIASIGVCFGNTDNMLTPSNEAVNINFKTLLSLIRVYEGWSFSTGANSFGSNQAYTFCPFIKRIDFADRGNDINLKIGSNNLTKGTLYMYNIPHELEKVILPNNLKGLAIDAFSHCPKLKNIEIPSEVTSIPSGCFDQCISLEMDSLPSHITSIGASSFANCYSLGKTFTFYGDIEEIGNLAFKGGTTTQGLASSVLKYKFLNNTTVPILGTNVFQNMNPKAVIVVPDSLYEQWIAASNWVDYASHIIKESEDV